MTPGTRSHAAYTPLVPSPTEPAPARSGEFPLWRGRSPLSGMWWHGAASSHMPSPGDPPSGTQFRPQPPPSLRPIRQHSSFLALSQGFSPARCCPPGGGRLTPSISAFAQPGTLTPGPLSEVALSPPGTQPLRAAGTVIHFANELTNKRYYRRMIFISLGKFSFIQITTNLILICPHYV